MDALNKLKQFDAYPKTLEDFRIKTCGGATCGYCWIRGQIIYCAQNCLVVASIGIVCPNIDFFSEHLLQKCTILS